MGTPGQSHGPDQSFCISVGLDSDSGAPRLSWREREPLSLAVPALGGASGALWLRVG